MAIHYAQSEGVSLGYQVNGEGSPTILWVPGAFSNLAISRYFPPVVEWQTFLARFGRLVTFDKRGTGVSDQSVRPISLDQQVADVEAVRVAAGAETAVVCGLSQGAPLAILYALAYPERVKALILLEGVCCDAADPYSALSDQNTLFDWGPSLTALDSDFAGWCWAFAERVLPDTGPDIYDAVVEYMQATASPASHRFIWRSLMGFDIRPMLRHVHQPTLVIHTNEDQMYSVQHGRYIADHIPRAEYIELSSKSHVPYFDSNIVPQMFDKIENFVSSLPSESIDTSSARVVTTVLFSDIVDSAEQQRVFGDDLWTTERGTFEKNSREIIEQARGRVIQFTGDGVMAAFDVPGDSLRAAHRLVQDAEQLGHPIRVGVHTGEVHRSGGDLHGLAVTIASRVASQGKAGEILTTPVVQGIVEGGDFEFSDLGEVDLKGIGTRRILRLV